MQQEVLSSVHFNDQLTFTSIKFLCVLIAVEWVRNQDFARLGSKVKTFCLKNVSLKWSAEQTDATKHVTSRWAISVIFWEKMPFGTHFLRF